MPRRPSALNPLPVKHKTALSGNMASTASRDTAGPPEMENNTDGPLSEFCGCFISCGDLSCKGAKHFNFIFTMLSERPTLTVIKLDYC